MVFKLGKTIWSIFEEAGIINNILRVSEPSQTLQEFPGFIKSPPMVQGLIKSTRQVQENGWIGMVH